MKRTNTARAASLILAATVALTGCNQGSTDAAPGQPASQGDSTGQPGSDTSPTTQSATPVPPLETTQAPDATPAPTGTTPTGTTPTGTTSATSGSSDTCSGLTAQQAVDRWLPKVAKDPTGEWVPLNGGAGYDPCASLSWIVLSTRGTGASPHQIMLFHQGTYVGTTLDRGVAFKPDVTRVNDHRISVDYRWVEGNEANADPKGHGTASFTWDASTGRVVQSGTLPPTR